MADGFFIAYYRVSTTGQGKSGLGLEAQRAAVAAYLNGGSWLLIGEFTEVESGKVDARPQLESAMARCRLTGATLIVAKLDRLSRDAAFLLTLNKSGLDIRAADMPDANTMMFGIMALVAQHEREMISARTKAALGAAKARGKKLGGWRATKADGSARRPGCDPAVATGALVRKADDFAARVGPMASTLRGNGLSLAAIAAELTAQHIATPRGGAWTATAVRQVLARVSGNGHAS
jgi:DNA invertase Pin-like site-specific DNA recombinase